MPKKILIQSGHLNCKSNCDPALRGSTGAAGEVDINLAVRDMLGTLLQAEGIEVKKVDANYNCDPTSLDTDWDLFLALHCDCNYANDSGSGFCDYPEPYTDEVTLESQRMTKIIQDNFFPSVGITVKSRSNKNTRFYYMWQSISAKTPCVLIEMGQVQDPHDYPILKDTNKIAKALRDSILIAFGMESATGAILEACRDKIEALENELQDMRESRNKWREKYESLDKSSTAEIQSKLQHIESLQITVAESNAMITQLTNAQEIFDEKIATKQAEVDALRSELDTLKTAYSVCTASEDLLNKELKRLKDKKYTTKEALVLLLESLKHKQ